MKMLPMKAFPLFVILLMTVSVTPLTLASWFIDAVHAPHSFSLMGPRSQITDSAGTPHIAYGEDHLYHAWRDGQIWQTEIVDPAPQTGRYTSFRVSGPDDLHIAYFDSLFRSIKYAHRFHGVWTIRSVVSGPDIAVPFAMALDQNNLPWIAFVDYASGRLLVTHRISGTEWAVESLADVPDTLNGIAMEIHQGMPRIAFSHGPSNASVLYFLYFDGTQWHSHPVDDSGDVGSDLDMVVSDQDDVHLSYMDRADAALRYVVFSPGGWPGAPQVVDDSGSCGYYSSIRLPASGLPVIAYLDLTAGHRIRYATFNGLTWDRHSLNVLGNPGLYLSITLLETGTPQFSYFDADDCALQFTHPSSSGWETDIVDTGAIYGVGHTLSLDSAGDPILAFNDASLGGVYLSRFDGTNWSTSVIDADPLSGGQMSAAVDSNYLSGICYSMLESGSYIANLRYAGESETGWTLSTIDDSDMTQMTSAMAFDSLDRPHVVYLDANQAVVKHATLSGANWQIETIASDSGYSISTAFDPSDGLHICYHSQLEGLKYGYRDTSGWAFEAIDSATDTGLHPKLAVDHVGQPCMVSYDETTAEIRYRTRTGATWESVVVDVVDLSTAGLAFDFDLSNRPCVLFHDNASLTLRYATTDSDGHWRTITIHPGPVKTTACDLAFDPLGKANISFFDVLTGDLFAGRQRPDTWYDLSISDFTFIAGDSFRLIRSIRNTTASPVDAVEYVILDVYGSYWFAPSWTPSPESTLRHIDPVSVRTDTLFDFVWPADVGAASGIRFWGGIVRSESMDLIDYDLAEFGWH